MAPCPAELPPPTTNTRFPLDAGRETQIIFDPGARAGLPAGRMAIDQQRPEAFRRTVHRGPQAAWTSADDHEIVQIACGRERPAETLGHLAWFGVADDRAVFEKQ